MWDAYKVSVKLTLVNGVSAGLAGLATQFRALNGHVNTTQNSLLGIERRLANIKRLGMIGGGMAAAGGFGLSLFRGPIEAASEYERAYARFKTLNLGMLANQQADQFARASQRFGTSSTDMMENLRESVGLLGNMGDAMKIAPKLAELNASNSMLFGDKVGSLDKNAVRAIMRFNDMRGLTNTPEDFMRGLNLAQRLVTGSGGATKFTDLETLAKRGGASFKGLSDDGVMMLATVLQEQGGSATGTALMSMYQNLIAGRTTKKAMAKLSAAGLAELGYVSHGTVGGKDYKTLQVTKIVGEELLRTNPGAWLMKYGVDAAKRSGAKNDSEVIAFINDLMSNRTGSNMAATFTTQSLQAMRDFKLAKNAMGAEQTIDEAKNTTSGRFLDLSARWKDLMIELGVMVLPTVIKATEGLIGILKSVKAFAKEFPLLTKGIVIAFGVLSALVAAGGVVMMATAAFKALGLALAFNALGGVGGLMAMARALPLVAGGMAMVSAAVLSAAAALAGAGYAGWKVGGWINDQLSDGTKDNIGRGIAKTLAFFGNDEAKETLAAEDRYIRSQKRQAVQVATQINIDGKQVATAVTQHQAKAAAKPQAGAGRFDGRMTPAHVGASGSW